MPDIGTCGTCYMYLSISGVAWFGFLTYVLYTDPKRMHIIAPDEVGPEADHKVTESYMTSLIVFFLYALIAGGLCAVKQSNNTPSEDIHKWENEVNPNGNAGVELAEYKNLKRDE